jgi:hypothetical protein
MGVELPEGRELDGKVAITAQDVDRLIILRRLLQQTGW